MRVATGWATVLLFACSRTITAAGFETKELPGFSIQLPAADVSRPADAASSGSMLLSLAKPRSYQGFGVGIDETQLVPEGSRQLFVQWATIAMAPDALTKRFIEGVATGIPGGGAHVLREEKFAPGRHVYLIGNDSAFVAAGMIACNDHFYVSVIMGLVNDRDAMLGFVRRVSASVVCKTMDAALGEIAPALQLPANFGRRSDPGVLVFLSTDGEFLQVNMVPKDMQATPGASKVLVAQIAGMFNLDPAGASLSLVDPPALPVRRAQISRLANKDGMDGVYIGQLYCPARDLTVVTTWYKRAGTLELARDRIQRVGCPGEPTQPVRSMKDVFGEACKAGNRVACSGLQAFPQ